MTEEEQDALESEARQVLGLSEHGPGDSDYFVFVWICVLLFFVFLYFLLPIIFICIMPYAIIIFIFTIISSVKIFYFYKRVVIKCKNSANF